MNVWLTINPLYGGVLVTLLLAACATPTEVGQLSESGNPDELLIVDCLLPGQVRQLGTKLTYQAPRRAIKTSSASCQIRGGEYVAFDRADAGTSLRIWMPQAEFGDAQAQTYVGEIYEKGLGVEPDYELAALWYQRAADQNYTRAQINLGYLYESGLGVEQNLTQAMNLYRMASGIEDGSLEYVSTIEFAQREAARRSAIELQERVDVLLQELAESEARYRALQNESRQDQSTLRKLRQEVEAKRQEVAAMTATQSGTSEDAARALNQINTVTAQLDAEIQRNRLLETQLQDSRQEIDSLKVRLDTDTAEIEQLKGELAIQLDLVRQIEQASASAGRETSVELERALAEVDTLKNAMIQLRQQRTELPAAVLIELADAEEKELRLANELQAQNQALNMLRSQQAQLEREYQDTILKLQSELELSTEEQTRVAGRLADTEITMRTVEAENTQLRNRLREQNEAVASREREQQRLAIRLSELAVSEQVSQEEKRAAEAAALAANNELELARHEQGRLVARLVEAELNARQEQIDATQQLAILERQLALQLDIVNNQRVQLDALEDTVTAGRAQAQNKASESVAQVVAVGPTIEIIEPPVLITRGPGEIIAQADGRIEILGRVSPASNIQSFSINGQNQSFEESGIFRYAARQVVDNLQLAAIDEQGASANLNFTVSRRVVTQPLPAVPGSIEQAQAPSDATGADYQGIEFGQYHAIIIGNNLHDSLSDLRTAETDARVIDQILRDRYNFSTQLLLNATRLEILQALDQARQSLSEDDNLLIYYAGHGQLDTDGARGYWLPVDAVADDAESWISNSVITNYIDSMPAKQIMLVADSCFSGTLTKASIPRSQEAMPEELRKRWLALMAKRKVRTVLSSGGVKPVYEGDATHSLFAEAFISSLSRNRQVLEGYRLYAEIRPEVQQSALTLGVEQIPQYSAVKHAGHEAGEFLFVLSPIAEG